MRAHCLRIVIKHHFCLFSTENNSFLRGTFEIVIEHTIGPHWQFVIVDSFPLKIIAEGGWVDDIESFGIFDLASKGLKLNDIVLGIQFRFFGSVSGWRQLKMADWSFSFSI